MNTHITPKHLLDHQAAIAVESAGRSVVERMTDVMIDKAGEGCHLGHFLDEGISASEVDANLASARALAAARFVRRDDTPPYDRAARLNEAAKSVLCLLPETVSITMHLMGRGFSKAELDDFLSEALAIAADGFAHAAGATQ